MLFTVTCTDKPGALQLRLDNRPAHLDHITKVKAITVGGPVFADDGETFVGSFFIMEADNREEVEALMAQDPYVKAGLFESIVIRKFKHTLPINS
jgi:uncharacterized protein YciI